MDAPSSPTYLAQPSGRAPASTDSRALLAGGQHRVPVFSRLRFEQFPGGHGDHPNPDALRIQVDGSLQRDVDLCAGGYDDQLGTSEPADSQRT